MLIYDIFLLDMLIQSFIGLNLRSHKNIKISVGLLVPAAILKHILFLSFGLAPQDLQ